MNRIASLACGTAAGLLLAAGSVSAHGGERTLEGAWEVITTVRAPAEDCANAPPLPAFPNAPNPFPAFNTFHEGGTMSEWGARSPPANRSSGHGVWERTGHNRFGYRLMFHSFADGLLSATMDIRTRIELSADGDTFTAVSRFLRTDTAGNVLNFCATMEGTRITF